MQADLRRHRRDLRVDLVEPRRDPTRLIMRAVVVVACPGDWPVFGPYRPIVGQPGHEALRFPSDTLAWCLIAFARTHDDMPARCLVQVGARSAPGRCCAAARPCAGRCSSGGRVGHAGPRRRVVHRRRPRRSSQRSAVLCPVANGTTPAGVFRARASEYRRPDDAAANALVSEPDLGPLCQRASRSAAATGHHRARQPRAGRVARGAGVPHGR